MKLPPVASLHPVPPDRAQVPVTEPPESVVPLSVPVTVPVRVRVLPPDCTVKERVPVTVELDVFVVRIMDPLWVPPETGKHCVEFELRN